MNLNKPLVVTMGEPAGIGPDICLALHKLSSDVNLVVIGDEAVLAERARLLGQTCDGLNILHQTGLGKVTPGALNIHHAEYVVEMLTTAVTGCLRGEYAGIVTAPVHKAVINQAGLSFSGHTEFLADVCGVQDVVMLLASSIMRMALVTTHIPLKSVPDAITAERLQACIEILHHSLQQDFGISSPHIGIAGLNPHAGEGGYLGHEEIDIMMPVIKQMIAKGIDVSLPLPADTLFTETHCKIYDAFLAMYHDQGLPVIKHAGFGDAVNITLGLPIIRTSVDHGTALELAGTGAAKPQSLLKAVQVARDMAKARETYYANQAATQN